MGTTTFVVFFAQLEGKGGVGAWPIGVSGGITIFVAFLAYVKRGDIAITKIDWLFFFSAISTLPLWYFTSNPLWAVVILTIVDILGFGPTVKKAYCFPNSESLLFYFIFVVRNLVVIMALEHYSVTTVFFPGAISMSCMLLIAMVVYRRRAISN